MKKSLLDKLVCPFDKQELKLDIYQIDTQDNIIEGLLSCKSCNRYYPIVHGIPIMAPDEYREPALEEPLMERWNKQLNAPKVENFRLAKTKKS